MDIRPDDIATPAKSAAPLQKVSYTHDAMIDLLIRQPMISQGEVARYFGYTESWISRLLSSDAFREMYAKKKGESDPLLTQGVEARLEALCLQSIEVLEKKLEANPSADVAIKTLEVTARAKGYGVAKSPQANFSFVVHMPRKADTPTAWVEEHKPQTLEAVATATVAVEGGEHAAGS